MFTKVEVEQFKQMDKSLISNLLLVRDKRNNLFPIIQDVTPDRKAKLNSIGVEVVEVQNRFVAAWLESDWERLNDFTFKSKQPLVTSVPYTKFAETNSPICLIADRIELNELSIFSTKACRYDFTKVGVVSFSNVEINQNDKIESLSGEYSGESVDRVLASLFDSNTQINTQAKPTHENKPVSENLKNVSQPVVETKVELAPQVLEKEKPVEGLAPKVESVEPKPVAAPSTSFGSSTMNLTHDLVGSGELSLIQTLKSTARDMLYIFDKSGKIIFIKPEITQERINILKENGYSHLGVTMTNGNQYFKVIFKTSEWDFNPHKHTITQKVPVVRNLPSFSSNKKVGRNYFSWVVDGNGLFIGDGACIITSDVFTCNFKQVYIEGDYIDASYQNGYYNEEPTCTVVEFNSKSEVDFGNILKNINVDVLAINSKWNVNKLPAIMDNNRSTGWRRRHMKKHYVYAPNCDFSHAELSDYYDKAQERYKTRSEWNLSKEELEDWIKSNKSDDILRLFSNLQTYFNGELSQSCNMVNKFEAGREARANRIEKPAEPTPVAQVAAASVIGSSIPNRPPLQMLFKAANFGIGWLNGYDTSLIEMKFPSCQVRKTFAFCKDETDSNMRDGDDVISGCYFVITPLGDDSMEDEVISHFVKYPW